MPSHKPDGASPVKLNHPWGIVRQPEPDYLGDTCSPLSLQHKTVLRRLQFEQYAPALASGTPDSRGSLEDLRGNSRPQHPMGVTDCGGSGYGSGYFIPIWLRFSPLAPAFFSSASATRLLKLTYEFVATDRSAATYAR